MALSVGLKVADKAEAPVDSPATIVITPSNLTNLLLSKWKGGDWRFLDTIALVAFDEADGPSRVCYQALRRIRSKIVAESSSKHSFMFIYMSAKLTVADLPISHLVRIAALVAEVQVDQFYVLCNLAQLDIEVPTGQMSSSAPHAPWLGQLLAKLRQPAKPSST